MNKKDSKHDESLIINKVENLLIFTKKVKLCALEEAAMLCQKEGEEREQRARLDRCGLEYKKHQAHKAITAFALAKKIRELKDKI